MLIHERFMLSHEIFFIPGLSRKDPSPVLGENRYWKGRREQRTSVEAGGICSLTFGKKKLYLIKIVKKLKFFIHLSLWKEEIK